MSAAFDADASSITRPGTEETAVEADRGAVQETSTEGAFQGPANKAESAAIFNVLPAQSHPTGM